MKQRQPLVRKTSLRSTTPLQRTGFARHASGPVKPRKQMPRHPGLMSREEKACRDAMAARSGGLCETHAVAACRGVAEVCSHRKRRSQSSKAEKWDVRNVLHSCWPCEAYLTAKGSTAAVRSRGWTVASSVDPARVPVWRWGQYVWLTPDGGVEPLDLMEVAEWVRVDQPSLWRTANGDVWAYVEDGWPLIGMDDDVSADDPLKARILARALLAAADTAEWSAGSGEVQAPA